MKNDYDDYMLDWIEQYVIELFSYYTAKESQKVSKVQINHNQRLLILDLELASIDVIAIVGQWRWKIIMPMYIYFF